MIKKQNEKVVHQVVDGKAVAVIAPILANANGQPMIGANGMPMVGALGPQTKQPLMQQPMQQQTGYPPLRQPQYNPQQQTGYPPMGQPQYNPQGQTMAWDSTWTLT